MKNLHAGIHRGCTSLHPSNSTQESSFSMSLSTLVLSGLLIVSFLVSVSCYLVVVLICISLSVSVEKAMAPHSSTLAWKIPWTEEPGGLQSMGSPRVRHN